MQRYHTSKGGDRAIFRNVYFVPPGSAQATTQTYRHPEYLSPEGASNRTEFSPVRSFQQQLNNTLDDLTKRIIAQYEGAHRCKVTYIVLDYIIDEDDQAYLLWPTEVRALDLRKDGTVIMTADTTGMPSAMDPDAPPQIPGWAAEKARMFEEQQAREQAVQDEFASLQERTVGDGHRGHVLIVDADPHAVVMATRALVSEGYAVTLVTDGPRALDVTRHGGVDCLLLGRDLPSMSGLEVAKILRQREAGLSGAGGHVPVVAFTGATEPDDLRQYMDAGMDGCVSKPVDMGALLSTMAAAVPVPMHSRKAAERAAQEQKQQQQQQQLAASTDRQRGLASTGRSAATGMPTTGLNMALVEAGQGNPGRAQNASSPDARQTMQATKSPYAKSQSLATSPGAEYKVDFGVNTVHPERESMAATPQGVRGIRSMAAARKTRPRQSKSPSRQAGPPPSTMNPSNPNELISLPAGSAVPGIAPPVGGSMGGAAGFAASLPVGEDEDGSRIGVFQLDAETAVPYCIMGRSRPGVPLFHFVVIGDIFDTYEQYQILFRKVVQRMPGLRVLLFNYPGQAFTEWRKDVVLNNEYCAGVLQALMTYLGPSGTGEFSLDGGEAPFHLMAIGNGGPIATYFAAAYHGSHPNMRSLLMVNGYAHVDAHTAGVLHDCMNVFACSPPTRPDLPVYFFARFLFSPSYLAKVGAPLALNLYTAVSNPISLQGRIALCQGALAHVDTRPALPNLNLPIVLVASSKDGFIKPSHVAVMVEARGGEVRSIKRALTERARAAVIWLRAGHEVFQEARKPMVNLLEQLASGYHERNDVSFLPLVPEDVSNGTSKGAELEQSARARAAAFAAQTSNVNALAASQKAASGVGDPLHPVPGGKVSAQMFEDRYLDNVVSTLKGQNAPQGYTMNPTDALIAQVTGKHTVQTTDVPLALMNEVEVPRDVLNYQDPTRTMPPVRNRNTAGTAAGKAASEEERRRQTKNMHQSLLLDPESTAFEKRDVVMGKGKQAVSSISNTEVKEYMSWRIRRNKRRLQRVEACAVTIQRAWRSYLARTLVARMRQQRAALDVQRFWRGCLGRKTANEKRRQKWAASVVQRYWKGYRGRSVTARLKAEKKAAVKIQRAWKGYRARKFVRMIQELRRTAAVKIQAAWRRHTGLREAWKRRDERNAAVNVQRMWRGYLGRARASKERDRYLFSKSQAQGIEFGRQMLMEHKLHGTKLQSEVSLLTKEKLATEEKIEAVLAEIATFEQGVRALEKEMVDLSRAEAEAAGTLDEDAKVELRENKIRLDREFAAMLVKIADRRETLSSLETKLQTLDRARAAKREELRDLERRLVVLLEAQQSELQAIRQRQERRSENVVEDAVSAVTAALQGKDSGPPGQKYLLNGKGGTMQLTDAPGGGTVNNTLGNTLGMGGTSGGGGGAIVAAGAGGSVMTGGGGNSYGPTPQQRAEAAALMASTETMMKFGFMSMSLTYFSSLNMVRAMRQLGTANTVLASNPMLALIGQMGAAAAGGGNPAAVALAAGGLSMGGGMPGIGNGSSQLALTAGTVGPGQMSASGASQLASSLGGTSTDFSPAVKPGQLPGQQAPEIALWTVGDVSHWLDSLALGQYKDAFADAAIDGAFLAELTDDDLRNTLGIEHALHRKKILSCILKLRQAEEDAKAAKRAAIGGNAVSMGMAGMGMSMAPSGGMGGTLGGAPSKDGAVGSLQQGAVEAAAEAKAAARDVGVLKLDDLASWVRHNKGKQLSEALSTLPDGKFDRSLIKSQFVQGFGTQYIDMLNGPAFHVNKADDKGNTLLLIACQNGRTKLAQLLCKKGANPNHQNSAGNTAMHYSMAYQFHELAAWLADPEKGCADDTILNSSNLGPYDGLGGD